MYLYIYGTHEDMIIMPKIQCLYGGIFPGGNLVKIL